MLVGRFKVDRKDTLPNVSLVVEVAPVDGASRMEKPCRVWWKRLGLALRMCFLGSM